MATLATLSGTLQTYSASGSLRTEYLINGYGGNE